MTPKSLPLILPLDKSIFLRFLSTIYYKNLINLIYNMYQLYLC